MPTYPYQFRRDTLKNWQSANPVLREGEMGLELPGVVDDDGATMFKFKIGDGVTAWNDLPYASGPAGPSPEYEWSGTSLRFMNPDGTWGKYVNLQGPQGAKGEQGDPGPEGTVTPATKATIGGVIIGDNINVTAKGCASVNDGSTSQKGVVQLTNATNSKTGKLAASDTALANTYAAATKAASTTQAGRVQLSNSLTSTSQTTAATSAAVKALNDKIADVTGKAYITATWHSGNDWYRKWSDGFIEQGGLLEFSGDGGYQTLNTPFTTTDYTIVFGKHAEPGNHYATTVVSQEKTGFMHASPYGKWAYYIATGY